MVMSGSGLLLSTMGLLVLLSSVSAQSPLITMLPRYRVKAGMMAEFRALAATREREVRDLATFFVVSYAEDGNEAAFHEGYRSVASAVSAVRSLVGMQEDLARVATVVGGRVELNAGEAAVERILSGSGAQRRMFDVFAPQLAAGEVIRGSPMQDSKSVCVATRYTIKNRLVGSVRRITRRIVNRTRQQDGILYLGFTARPENERTINSRDCYESGLSLLGHALDPLFLPHALALTAATNDLLVELHGRKEEIDRARFLFAPMGAKFYTTD